MVCLAYFLRDSKEASLPQKVKDLIEDCEAEGLDLVIGCDANSHHTGGSSDCNIRGETLLELLGTTKLGILNVSWQPTFRSSVLEEVLDISLASGSVTSKIRSWRVSDEISMSDHRLITFELTDVKPEIKLWRNPRKKDWFGYEKELTEKFKQVPVGLTTGCEIDRSYENDCSLNSKAEGHGKIWGSPELFLLCRRKSEDCIISHTNQSLRLTGQPLKIPKSQLAEILFGG